MADGKKKGGWGGTFWTGLILAIIGALIMVGLFYGCSRASRSSHSFSQLQSPRSAPAVKLNV